MDADEHPRLQAAAPGKIAHPEHGTWPGHVLPGSFFVLWGLWWAFSLFRLQAGHRGRRRSTFRARAWYEWPGTRLPVEPALKVALPFLGLNAELWAGHQSFRRLFGDDGRFVVGNLQDWQHAAMYAAFLASGVADLAGHGRPRQLLLLTALVLRAAVFLALAFAVEGLLFGFHLKGTRLDVSLHALLVGVVLAAALVCLAEVAAPSSVLLSAARAHLVLLQGAWFIQIAHILFTDDIAWDPEYHGSAMMVAPLFAAWLVGLALAGLLTALGARLCLRRLGAGAAHHPVNGGDTGAWEASKRDVEFAALAPARPCRAGD